MKIGILHLSDIHIEDEDDWVLNKATSIAKAAVANVFDDPVGAFFIIVSGDVANKGFESQYAIANDFFSELGGYVVNELNVPVHFILVPGNHDCDFTGESENSMREIAIKAVIENPAIVNKGNDVYAQCLKVQSNFFNFAGNLSSDINYPNEPEVYYQLRVAVGEYSVVFNCFNTAWLTRNPENQGRLLMPPELAKEAESLVDQDQIAFSIYHHPDNWLSADNANEFRPIIESISDVTLTGHEHHREIYTKREVHVGNEVIVQRAAALQERSNPTNSGFAVLMFDLESSQFRIKNFHWSDDNYKTSHDSDWIAFNRNKYLLRGQYKLKPIFKEWVNNLDGTPITHSRKPFLRVDDLYVRPRLKTFSLRSIIDGKKPEETVKSRDLETYIAQKKKILLYGETLQGKSTAAKFLFLRFREAGTIPLFVDGALLISEDLKTITKVLRSAFNEQYENETFEDFLQLEKSRRMIIIDNFGAISLRQPQLQGILRSLSDRFEYVIAIGHSNLRIQQFVRTEKGAVVFSEFTHSILMPMNRLERSELVQNWVFLSPGSRSNESLAAECHQKQQLIETAVDAAILLPYPPYLLGAIQLTEGASLEVDQTKYGTFGYLYESLITNRFQSLNDKDLDLGQTFLLLGKMAYECFGNEHSLLISFDETHTVILDYQSDYQSNVYEPRFVEQIVAAGIVKRNEQNLEFVNPQLRDFFVAKHLSECLHSEKDGVKDSAMAQIDFIVKTVSFETHTRVLLFLVFLAADRVQFIRHVLKVSAQILAEFEPADFDEDVRFLNELKDNDTNIPKLEDGDVWARRAAQDKGIDEATDNGEISAYDNNKDLLIEYREGLDEFVKAAIALKMIEVLGQLVRSFSTTLQGPLKIDLVKECTDLGLRLLKSLLEVRGASVDDIRAVLGTLIREKHRDLTEKELLERADEFLLTIFKGLTYGVLRKISVSVGLDDLKKVYAALFNLNDLPLNYRMVDAALRLEHYSDPNIDGLLGLAKDLEGSNKFMWEIIRLLFYNFLNYSSAVSREQKDKILHELKLVDNPQFLLNSERLERQYFPKAPKRFLPPSSEHNQTK